MVLAFGGASPRLRADFPHPMPSAPTCPRHGARLFFAASLVCPAFALASEPSGLPPVLVTETVPGSGAPADAAQAERRVRLARVNGGVNLVSADEVAKAPLPGLSDMLRGQVGVDTAARTSPDATFLSIRGSGSNDKTGNGRGVIVLQDGLPLNQADGLMELSPVDPQALAGIEVWRGANALRYGANSLGGAVNLLSHTALTSPGLTLLGMGGSYGYAKGFASAGGSLDAFDGYGAYSYSRTDGYRQNSAAESHRVNVNVGARLAEGVENRVFAGFTDYYAQSPGDVTRAVLEDAPRSAAAAALLYETYRAYSLARVGDTLSFFNDDTRCDLSAGYYYRDLDEHGADSVTDKVTTIGSLSGVVRHDGDWNGHRATSTAGFNVSTGVVDDNRYRPQPGTSVRGAKREASEQYADTVELFGEQDYYVTRREAVTVGAQGLWTTRRLHYSFNKAASENRDKEYVAFNPKFGVRHEFDPKTVLFANVSRSYEAPTFGQFKTPRADQPSNLDAQRAWTVEAGLRGEHRRVAWEIVPYYSLVKGEFLTYSTGPAASQFTTLNADETAHRGVELGLDVELLSEMPSGASVRDGAPRTRLVLRNTGNLGDHRFQDDALYGDNRLAGTSLYRHRAELMFEHKGGFYVGPNVEVATSPYIDSANTYKAPAYATVGVQTGYRWRRGARVFVEGRNLTGERYSPTLSTVADAGGADQAVFRPADGPSVFGGVEVRF